MKISSLHDSAPAELVRGLVRMVRRVGDPLLRPIDATAPGHASGGSASAPMYGTRDHAVRAFARRRSMSFAAPEVDRRLLLLAAMGGSARPDQRHAVLDVGGSSGFHREQVQAVLGTAVPLDWAVVETAAFCEAATSLSTDDTRYFSSVEAALAAGFAPTCIYANSSLQYFDDPLATLHGFVASGARSIVVERTPMSARTDIRRATQYLRESGSGELHTPICIIPASSIQALLHDAGFAMALYRESRAVFRLGSEFIDFYSLVAIRSA